MPISVVGGIVDEVNDEHLSKDPNGATFDDEPKVLKKVVDEVTFGAEANPLNVPNAGFTPAKAGDDATCGVGTVFGVEAIVETTLGIDVAFHIDP